MTSPDHHSQNRFDRLWRMEFWIPASTPLGKLWPTKVAQAIFTKHLPAWINLFLQKNASYGESGYHDLGIKGYWPEIRRKLARLERALWRDEDTSTWTEQPTEIIFDLIGTLLMCYDLLATEQTFPSPTPGVAQKNFPTPYDNLTDSTRAHYSVGPDGSTWRQYDTPQTWQDGMEQLAGEATGRYHRVTLAVGGTSVSTGVKLLSTGPMGATLDIPAPDPDEPGDGGWCALPDSVKAVLQDINDKAMRGQPVSKEQAIVLADYYSEHGERL